MFFVLPYNYHFAHVVVVAAQGVQKQVFTLLVFEVFCCVDK